LGNQKPNAISLTEQALVKMFINVAFGASSLSELKKFTSIYEEIVQTENDLSSDFFCQS
jgi:hypothetical protein